MRRDRDRLVRLLRGHRLDDLRRRVVVRVARLVVPAPCRSPVPLVIVNVTPTFEQTPALENATAPAGAVAATPKLVPNTAVPGACVETVIVWAAFCAVTDSTTCGAAL